MTKIQKLPKNIVNILSAWEVVERPYSVIKELVENSIDAQATEIILEVEKWWNELIKVIDNGIWINKDELKLTIQEYATSKINKIEDIYNIHSFWFRWEALSTISEVSKFTLQSKTKSENIWYEIIKMAWQVEIKPISLNFEHGTIIVVQDLFYNVPVRKKFLKAPQTEFKYIDDIFLKFAIRYFDKSFKLIHNKKIIKDFSKQSSLLERTKQIYPSSWEENFIFIEHKDENYNIYGIIWKSILKFNSNMIKLFVNNRSIKNNIIQRAIMQAYNRWLEPWLYPFAVLFIYVKPDLVDVNVHPRKEEVKFIDPWSIYNLVYKLVKENIESKEWLKKQSSYIDFQKTANKTFQNRLSIQDIKKVWEVLNKEDKKENNLELNFTQSLYSSWEQRQIEDIKIIWQIFDSYILFQKEEDFYIMDQHAVAERIIFEKMRKEFDASKQSLLSVPLSFDIKEDIDLEKFQKLGFDISYFWKNKLIVYSVPQILEKYNIDLSNLLNNLIYSKDIDLDKVLEQVFATKSCKAAIKANHKLSFVEMEQLIKDALKYIDWFFVCQHGRPSIVQLSKHDIDKFFDRK